MRSAALNASRAPDRPIGVRGQFSSVLHPEKISRIRVVTKQLFACSGERVYFEWDYRKKAKVFIQDETGKKRAVGPENLPKELRGRLSKDQFLGYLKHVYLTVRRCSDNTFNLSIHQRGVGGVPALDLSPLNDSPYILFPGAVSPSSKKVIRYTYDNTKPPMEACKAIFGLLEKNPVLTPTFPVAQIATLEQMIKTHSYLTINGEAVSLSQKGPEPDEIAALSVKQKGLQREIDDLEKVLRKKRRLNEQGEIVIPDLSRLTNSPYTCFPANGGSNSLPVYRYRLDNRRAPEDAVKAIIELLKTNSRLLTATFPMSPEEPLLEHVKTHPYLTINGQAVCLSREGSALTSTPPEYTDALFSGTLLEDPVRCELNHPLEKERAIIWGHERGGDCPAGGHEIGTLVTDEKLKLAITNWRIDKKKQADDDLLIVKKQKETLENNEKLSREKEELAQAKQKVEEEREAKAKEAEELKRKHEAAEEDKKKLRRLSEVYSKHDEELKRRDVARTEKLGVLGINAAHCALLAERAFQETAATSLPGAGTAITVVSAGVRLAHGQYMRAGMEVVACVATCFPGPGTAAAVGIKTVVAGIDLFDDPQKAWEDNPYEEACRCLEVDPAKASKTDVDKAFAEQAKIFHPDHNTNGPLSNESSPMMIKAKKARDDIYSHKKWT